jgi:hypothetical protein
VGSLEGQGLDSVPRWQGSEQLLLVRLGQLVGRWQEPLGEQLLLVRLGRLVDRWREPLLCLSLCQLVEQERFQYLLAVTEIVSALLARIMSLLAYLRW